ncbi:MAG: N-acetylneuraminate synthase family protein [Woeseiaceae bacterium]|nr:N-acetylneuraminate synthase family protein [Woeseiaceae bacterium]
MGDKIIKIGDNDVGIGESVHIIAEIGINHDGDMAKAVKLIQEAKKSGADSAKLQTYITEHRVPKEHAVYGILKQCELSHAHQKELFDLGADLGITVFSTPFDNESVDFLEGLGAPVYKIASFDSVNTQLLKKVSATGKPIIMSTGMTSLDELGSAWSALGGNDDGTGCDLLLMHCVSSYPLEDTRANLSIIPYLHSIHGGPVGYSDHTIGTKIPLLGVAAGATLIEKHFTLDINSEGPDHAMSADPGTLSELVKGVRWVEEVLGKREMGIRSAEEAALSYRRPS